MEARFTEPTPGMALFLRTCCADMTGHGGFQWPDVGGQVKAPRAKQVDKLLVSRAAASCAERQHVGHVADCLVQQHGVKFALDHKHVRQACEVVHAEQGRPAPLHLYVLAFFSGANGAPHIDRPDLAGHFAGHHNANRHRQAGIFFSPYVIVASEGARPISVIPNVPGL